MTIAMQQHVSLKPYNTFGIAANARYFTELKQLTDLPALLDSLTDKQPVLWLGGGSNILLRGDFSGVVVRMGLRGIHVLADEGETLIIEAAAGENWHDFVGHTLAQGWCGLENLSLIPGTVGASPIQNIGAYGVEVKDLITEVVCADLHQQGQEVVLQNADCQFSYRDSLFKQQSGRYLVTAVRFRLSRQLRAQTAYGDIARELAKMGISHASASDISRAVIAIRQSKLPDPAVLGNAGSFFKNPIIRQELADALIARLPTLPHYPAGEGRVKLAAGWLIDQAGLKGYRQGDAAVHDKQALVLVNHGSASGADILALAAHIQQTVQTRYGVTLETEPVSP